MPGVSLYGREEYSFGPYSKNPRIYFTGKITIKATLSGDAVMTRSFSGALSVSVNLVGQPEVVFGYTGYLRINTSMTGDNQIHRNSKGTIPVSAALTGQPKVVHIRHMIGEMRVKARFKGKPSMQYSFGAALGVSVTIKGDPYVGPFWADDKPHSPIWGAIPEKETNWEASRDNDPNWAPVPRDATVWKDDVPVDGNWRPI